MLAGAVVILFGHSHDRLWLVDMHIFHDRAAQRASAVARLLSYWGDYPTYNLPVAILMWVCGTWRKSRAWRLAALVCLFSASLAGLTDDLFKFALGRPRPDAGFADGFYGPAMAVHGDFRSFPSGHSASDVGMGVALLGVNRPLGWLATAYAFLVVWSRMELNRHYPSDVIVGSIIGVYCGLLIGMAGTRLQVHGA